MTSLETFLFWAGWFTAVPTLLFALLWVVAVLFCRLSERRWADPWDIDEVEDSTSDGAQDYAPSVKEADAMLRDPVSPDCSPLNSDPEMRRRRSGG